MITKIESPTSTSADGMAFHQPAMVQTSALDLIYKKENSPKSPTQDSLSNKRARNRHVPYQNTKSPTGSCSSSDECSNESETGDFSSPVESKTKRMQANSRERKRMHTVNSAFDELREMVPTYPSNRKLSKIDTLRLACTYIQDLVSVLHQTRAMQNMQGDELAQFPIYGDGYGMPGPYSPCFNVKSEGAISEFPAFTNYRMPSTCITPTCDSDYSTSETETHSPPYLPPTSHSGLPAGIAVRPPPLSRTSSDSAAQIHRPMAHATVSVTGGTAHSQSQRQMTIPSPLATHAVQHTTQSLLSNELNIHHPPPVWQRCGSMPTYPLYGQ